MPYEWEERLGFMAIVVGVTVFVCLVVALANHTAYPGDMARIESVRRDVARAEVGENEDVIGQAVAINAEIAVAQRYNGMWWSGWMVHNGWDDLQPIHVGK